MVKRAVDKRRQTDAAVAYHSKSNQERFARQLPLGNVVIGHLSYQQGAFFFSSFEHEKLFLMG
jgi:hypothetical protein